MGLLHSSGPQASAAKMQVVGCKGASASNEILSLLHPAGRKRIKEENPFSQPHGVLWPHGSQTLLLSWSTVVPTDSLPRHATASATPAQTCHRPTTP